MTETWPIEPPLAGTEREHLIGMLDRLRATFRWKAGGLNADQLNARISSSELTLGGLLKHLSFVEATQFTWKTYRLDPGEPWTSVDWEADADWDFHSAANDSPAELYALYDSTVAASRRRLDGLLDDGGLDQLTEITWQGQRPTLRRSSATWSRSTAAIPATPTSSASRSTDWSGRTRRRAGSPAEALPVITG